jgi:hypothetical protein
MKNFLQTKMTFTGCSRTIIKLVNIISAGKNGSIYKTNLLLTRLKINNGIIHQIIRNNVPSDESIRRLIIANDLNEPFFNALIHRYSQGPSPISKGSM